MTQQEETLNLALMYAELGWHVFPVQTIIKGECSCGVMDCADKGKHPAVSRGLKEATADPEIIKSWFGEDAPPRNVAVVTGEVSGITVIDIDVGKGKLGAESWQELIKEHGEPQTLMATTGSGGMHVLFKYSSALKTSSNTLGPNIDCRNDGGYIIVAPSLHRSGSRYEWLNYGTALSHLPAYLTKRIETRGRKRKDDLIHQKYSIEQVEGMLDVVPADDRDLWRHVGVILGRHFNRADEAWSMYVAWAEKAGGSKGRNHDEIMHEAFYELSQQKSDNELTIGTIIKAAIDNGWAQKTGEVPLGNFVYYAPDNAYIYRAVPNNNWIAAAVDAAVSPVNEDGKITKASEWLKRNQLATSLTCNPQLDDDYLKGFDCVEGDLVESSGGAVFNKYRKASIKLGDANLAKPFLAHVAKVFNKKGDAEQFLSYMAHRVQKPWEKPRFALLISGGQGVGKDTAIEFSIPAIGSWNVSNIDPSAFEASFNEYAASTLVRINEAANLHEMSKWAFNERTKVLIAGSPDVCQINPKYGKKFSVKMFCGVILTTNHLASGIFIPKDDRRFDVIDCATLDEMGLADVEIRRKYFEDLWSWFHTDGANHIAAYLTEKDISAFSPNNGQRKTEAHQSVIDIGRERHLWFRDILAELDHPRFISFPHIKIIAQKNGEETSNLGAFTGRLKSAIEDASYFKYANPNSKESRWKKTGCNKAITIYAKQGTCAGLDPRDEVKAESELF